MPSIITYQEIPKAHILEALKRQYSQKALETTHRHVLQLLDTCQSIDQLNAELMKRFSQSHVKTVGKTTPLTDHASVKEVGEHPPANSA